jgi:hypothetical protein
MKYIVRKAVLCPFHVESSNSSCGSTCGDPKKKVAINKAVAMHPFDSHSIGPFGA